MIVLRILCVRACASVCVYGIDALTCAWRQGQHACGTQQPEPCRCGQTPTMHIERRYASERELRRTNENYAHITRRTADTDRQTDSFQVQFTASSCHTSTEITCLTSISNSFRSFFVRRYVTAGQVTAASKRLQSTAASQSHAIHADEPPSGRHDESQYASARTARPTERRRGIGSSSSRRSGYDEGRPGGHAAEYGCDSQVWNVIHLIL